MKTKLFMLIAMLSICSMSFAQFTGESNSQSYQSASDGKAGKVGSCYELAFGYVMPSLGDASDYMEAKFSFSAIVDLGARYYFTNNIYAEGLFGYKYLNTVTGPKNGKSSDNSKVTIHDLTIPIHAGFKYPVSNKFGIGLHAGPRIDIPVSSKGEYAKEKYDVDIPVTVLAEGGVDFVFGEEQNQNLRLQFGYSPSKNNKYSIISIGFSAMF